MALNWTAPAQIYELLLHYNKDGEEGTIDLRGGFIAFNYYETMLSPHITAKLMIVDTGSSDVGEDATRASDILSGIGDDLTGTYIDVVLTNGSGNGLTPSSEEFNFSYDYPLYVESISNETRADKVRMFVFNLYSKGAHKNNKCKILQEYNTSITESVKAIIGTRMNQVLKPVESSEGQEPTLDSEFEENIPGYKRLDINFEPTSNTEVFKPNDKRPFDLILEMATHAKPVSGSAAGFLFYENIDGFNFRSVEDLASHAPYPVRYVNRDTATFCEQSNFRILDYNIVKSSLGANLISKFQFTNNIFFSPSTLKYEEVPLTFKDGVFSKLGGNELLTADYRDRLLEYSKTNFFVRNNGNDAEGITGYTEEGEGITNDPLVWYALGTMRYQFMMGRRIDAIVPCNLELKIGMIIECEFPMQTDVPQEGIADERMSGKWMIFSLAHKFSQNGEKGSITHLSLTREGDGIYTVDEGVNQ